MANARITIEGPVGCGKSTVAAEIVQMLREKFNVHAVIVDADTKHGIECSANPAEWEKEMVAKTVWEIKEDVKHTT